MTLYIGVDFHPHQQTVSYCRTETGEVYQTSLSHNVELVRRFYEQFKSAVVGLLRSLAVVHTLGDVRRFASSKQAVAFVGLDPLERSSAGKTRTGAISKAGSPLLRDLLGHAMHSAVRFDGELKAFYKRLAKRLSKSIAKVAATRKLLIRLFIMRRDGIDYAEFKRRGSAVGIPAVSQGLR